MEKVEIKPLYVINFFGNVTFMNKREVDYYLEIGFIEKDNDNNKFDYKITTKSFKK